MPEVYVDGGDGVGSALTIDHTTITDHKCEPTVAGSAVNVTGMSKVNINNSIPWNNGGDEVEMDETSRATFSYTLAQDTLFTDSARREYRLSSNSPAIDAAVERGGGQSGWPRHRDECVGRFAGYRSLSG